MGDGMGDERSLRKLPLLTNQLDVSMTFDIFCLNCSLENTA